MRLFSALDSDGVLGAGTHGAIQPSHGGGRPGKEGFCAAHGGGGRCFDATCTRGAKLPSHGGGRPGEEGFCAAHGGGGRCTVGATDSASGCGREAPRDARQAAARG